MSKRRRGCQWFLSIDEKALQLYSVDETVWIDLTEQQFKDIRNALGIPEYATSCGNSHMCFHHKEAQPESQS